MKRNTFFKIDLLIGCIWALFVVRLWVANMFTSFCIDDSTIFPEWALLLVAYTVLMRISLSFMMLRKEKRGLWVALVYMLIGGVCHVVLPKDVMLNALRDMYNYGMAATAHAFSPRWITSQLSPYLFLRTIKVLFPIWLLGMPFIYLVINRKKCVSSDISGKWLWSGLYWWKDAWRNKFLGGCAFFLVAWCFGIIMNEWLSLIAMIVLPALAYYYMNKGWGSRARCYEYLFVVASSCLLWFAQYEIGGMRERMLWMSALLVLVPVGFVWRTKGWLDGAWAFVAIGVLLPSFCLGYDVYTVKEAKRIGNFRDEMCFTGVLEVKDGEGHVALRDRYRLLIPWEYMNVHADRLPLVKVLKDGKWETFNTWKAGYPKGDMALLKDWQRKVNNFFFYEDLSAQKKTFEDWVQDARYGNAEAYMELAKHYRSKSGDGPNYLNAMFCAEMAYQLIGENKDLLATEFAAIHHFRLAMELVEEVHSKEKAAVRMDILRTLAPMDAKAVEGVLMIRNENKWEEGFDMLDEAEKEGSDIAAIGKIICLEKSDKAEVYEQLLISRAKRFPFLYNKLGSLYMMCAKAGVNRDIYMSKAVECYKEADKHAMLDRAGMKQLYQIYQDAWNEGKPLCGRNELRRLEWLDKRLKK